MQNLLFYKQFETRLQELKQIWNEIRGQKPVKEEKRETTIIPGVYKMVFCFENCSDLMHTVAIWTFPFHQNFVKKSRLDPGSVKP